MLTLIWIQDGLGSYQLRAGRDEYLCASVARRVGGGGYNVVVYDPRNRDEPEVIGTVQEPDPADARAFAEATIKTNVAIFGDVTFTPFAPEFELIPAWAVREGDMIDLEGDYHADRDRDHIAFQSELQVVGSVERETDNCVAILFEGFDKVGFPTDHLLKVSFLAGRGAKS